MSTAAAAVLAALAGAVLGSFFNVVIHRLPRKESLLRPASRCPKCETPIKPWHNVPILGWLLLRGRCAECGEPISPRYPLVEALTAALFALVVIVVGPEKEVWLGLALVALLIPLSFIDIDHHILPNKLTGLGAVLGLVLVLLVKRDDLVEHLIAAAAAGGFFFVVAIAYPRGMGMGDVKLVAVMGLFLGRAVAPAVFIGLIVGTIVGLVTVGRGKQFPFGPSLAFGALVGLLAGDEIVDWYLDTFG